MIFGNKKAQGTNYMAVILALFFFGFFNILGYTIWLEIVEGLEDSNLFTEGSVADQTIEGFSKGFRAFDYVTVGLVIIWILATGLLSFRIKTKSAFFIITFILGIFWGFVSYFFNYVFIQLVSPSIFQTAIGFFPRTMLICTNLHWVMLILIVVGSITLYGKKEEQLQTLT